MLNTRIILCAITLSGCVCDNNEGCDPQNMIKNMSIYQGKNRKPDMSIVRTSPFVAPLGIPLYQDYRNEQDGKSIERCQITCVDNKNVSRSTEFDF